MGLGVTTAVGEGNAGPERELHVVRLERAGLGDQLERIVEIGCGESRSGLLEE